MLILVFSLVVLVVILFYMFWTSQQDLRDAESGKKYWISRYESQCDLCFEERRKVQMLEKELQSANNKVQMLEKELQSANNAESRMSGYYFESCQEVAALQKQLKALTPETPQAPWWIEQ